MANQINRVTCINYLNYSDFMSGKLINKLKIQNDVFNLLIFSDFKLVYRKIWCQIYIQNTLESGETLLPNLCVYLCTTLLALDNWLSHSFYQGNL